MKVIDVHVHLRGKVEAAEVERFLETTGLTAAVLISRGPDEAKDGGRAFIEEAAELQRKLPDRVYAFARIDPNYPKAPELLEWAIKSCGVTGLKMLPSNFHPADPCARAMYEMAGRLKVPMLMHTGILWVPGNNANNCRPANMEVMWDYPQARFAMAHIGWPWTDECIAVAQKLRVLRPELDQAFVDITPGTPPAYREPALARCFENVRVNHILYGSDACLPKSDIPEGKWRKDKEIFTRLGVSEENQEKIFYKNALRFLGKA